MAIVGKPEVANWGSSFHDLQDSQLVFVLIPGTRSHRMFKGSSSREHVFTGQALAKALAKRDEYLASLVGADGFCASLGFVANHHVA